MKNNRFLLWVPLVLLVTAVLAACAGSTPAEPGIIAGKVWEDTNGNGLKEEIELGVQDIRVELRDPDGTLIDSVLTSDEGNYEFDRLEAYTDDDSVDSDEEISEEDRLTIVVIPEGYTFTNPGGDSDVSKETGSADTEVGFTVNAGLVPPAVAQAPSPTPTHTPAPSASATPTATATPAEDTPPEPGDDAAPIPLAGSYIDCESGAEIPPPAWTITGLPIFNFTDQTITIEVPVDNPNGTELGGGVDFSGDGLPQTGPIEGFVLFQGTNVGFGFDPFGNTNAGQTLDSGQFLNLDTSTEVEIQDGVYRIEIPVSELQGGLGTIRITFTDLDICWLSGSLGLNDGFTDINELGPALAEFLAGIQLQRICPADLCFMLPEDFTFESTGQGIGDLTFPDGIVGQLTTGIRQGGVADVQGLYTSSGWNLQPSNVAVPFVFAEGDFVISWLEANGSILGIQAAAESDSTDTLRSIDFAITFPEPVEGPFTDTLTETVPDLLLSLRALPNFNR